MEGVDILTTKEIHYPLNPKHIEVLIHIRAGDLDFVDVEALFHYWENKLKQAADTSTLPKSIDMNAVNDLFLNLTLDKK